MNTMDIIHTYTLNLLFSLSSISLSLVNVNTSRREVKVQSFSHQTVDLVFELLQPVPLVL